MALDLSLFYMMIVVTHTHTHTPGVDNGQVVLPWSVSDKFCTVHTNITPDLH